MGWLFWHKPKGVKAVDAIKGRFGAEWWAEKVVATTATREAVFIVIRTEKHEGIYVPDADGTARALIVLAIKTVPNASDGYNFGYKDMDETMGPYGLEAPMSIIAQCSELLPLIGDPEYSSLKSAIEYRARCARVAAQKALKRGLKPGDKVTLPEPLTFGTVKQQRFTVEVARVRGRAGKSTVFRAENGMLCGITAKQLEGAKIEAAAA